MPISFMRHKNRLFRNNSAGFSIVEMIVAVALFSMVALMSVAAMVSLVDANYKARSVKIAMDNLNFVLDGMARDIRLGSKYYCQASASTPVSLLADADDVNNCIYEKTDSLGSGGSYLLFRDRIGKVLAYRFYNGCIYRKTTNTNWSTSYVDSLSAGYSCLISSDITIDRFRFYVYKTEPASNAQPYVVISAWVTVGSNPKTKTSFSIQTTVSQRIPHNVE